jgi:amidase
MRSLRLAAAGAVVALGLAVAPSVAAPAAPKPVGSPAADCLARIAGLDLQTATVSDLQRAMASGRLTSRALTQAYVRRVKAYDKATNAVRVLSPTALAEADRLDRERRAGKVRGPLHGVPVLLKDNIGTRTVPTTAGSIALEGNVPKQEAFVTQRLRAAGAVVLGKTNLSEFANWMSLGMPNGYSSLGGQVNNAYDGGDPSGSSAGSGVAGSMAYAAVTLGSETSGSILSPSDVNGLVGVKPTHGLVSGAGVIPLAHSFDVAGPMTRNVTDAAAVLTAIAGPDERDPATAASKPADYLKGLSGASLKGVRLGYPANRARDPLFAEALEELEALGAELVPGGDEYAALSFVGLTEIGEIPNEFKTGLNDYLAQEAGPLKSGVKTLSDIIAYNKRHPQQVMYGQNLLEASDTQPGVYPFTDGPVLATRTSSRAAIEGVLTKDGLDAIIAPGPAYANVGAAAGYPTVIVPNGTVNDTRADGLSFLGTAFDEADLLRYAAAFEKATQRRVPPTVGNPDLLVGC